MPAPSGAARGSAPAALIARIAREPVKFRTGEGEGWAYHDFGYLLLGLVMERAAGQPYATFMTERLFRPRGVASTRVYDPTDVAPNRASGDTWKDGQYRRGRLTGQAATDASGDILSTVNDLAKWSVALVGDRLLPTAPREQLRTPARLKDGRVAPFSLPIEVFKGCSYGFGRVAGSLRGHTIVA